MSPDERELRRLFQALHEDQPTPPFERVWRGAARRAGRRTRRFALAAATATALLVAAGVALRWQAQPAAPFEPDLPAQELAAELAAWSSPLDFLGQLPGDELFAGEPLPPGEARELLQLMSSTEPDLGETI